MNRRFKKWLIAISITVVGGFVCRTWLPLQVPRSREHVIAPFMTRLFKLNSATLEDCKLGWWSGYSISFGATEGPLRSIWTLAGC